MEISENYFPTCFVQLRREKRAKVSLYERHPESKQPLFVSSVILSLMQGCEQKTFLGVEMSFTEVGVLWFKPGWQLSTTQLLAHSPPVGWGRELEE